MGGRGATIAPPTPASRTCPDLHLPHSAVSRPLQAGSGTGSGLGMAHKVVSKGSGQGRNAGATARSAQRQKFLHVPPSSARIQVGRSSAWSCLGKKVWEYSAKGTGRGCQHDPVGALPSRNVRGSICSGRC